MVSLTLSSAEHWCFQNCLINSLIVLANGWECFCCFSRTWNCHFRVIEERTAWNTYPAAGSQKNAKPDVQVTSIKKRHLQATWHRRTSLLLKEPWWYDSLNYPTWNRPNASPGALENPLGILLTGHIGISRGPQPLCPLCLKQKNWKHCSGLITDMQKVGQPTVLAHAANNRTWEFTSSTSESNPWLHGPKLTCFQDPLGAVRL